MEGGERRQELGTGTALGLSSGVGGDLKVLEGGVGGRDK